MANSITVLKGAVTVVTVRYIHTYIYTYIHTYALAVSGETHPLNESSKSV